MKDVSFVHNIAFFLNPTKPLFQSKYDEIIPHLFSIHFQHRFCATFIILVDLQNLEICEEELKNIIWGNKVMKKVKWNIPIFMSHKINIKCAIFWTVIDPSTINPWVVNGLFLGVGLIIISLISGLVKLFWKFLFKIINVKRDAKYFDFHYQKNMINYVVVNQEP